VSPLARTRRVFWAVVLGVIVLVAVGLLRPDREPAGFRWLGLLAAATGALVVAAVWWIRRRPMRADDDDGLARVFFARTVLGVAVSEIPFLVGFAGTMVAGDRWPVLVGTAFGAIALSLVAPTDREIDRRQAELGEAGSGLSLRDALGAGS
jgi:hypothetical protein